MPERILATDCGSTTTKAILIEKDANGYRLVVRGEAPTTVEAPFDDVTVGVVNAAREVEELAGIRVLFGDKVTTRAENPESDIDLYLSTSSAGGGLQMTVAGVVSTMTAESASRAALGAGAIVMDVIAVDDHRKEFERIERIRNMRPDMVLLAGGTDGGTVTHVLEFAEMLLAADPKPRLGQSFKLPVIYAGNTAAREEVQRILDGKMDLRIVDNIRPSLDTENLAGAREAIHHLFLEHVMQQAPGYPKLTAWASADILSTPAAVGAMVEMEAKRRGASVLAVDIGGATTDVFSVFGGVFHRTVSANLGMSYSVCNVLAEAGTGNVIRWLPFQMDPTELRNRLRNKMIRPTTIPQTVESLLIEQAAAREALRLAFDHHKQLVVGLKGIQQTRTIGDALTQSRTGATLVNLMDLQLIIGSGGVLSHAPDRAQAMIMMIDAFQPEGVTELAVDSIFMMPQLGVLAQVVPEASAQVFERDCLIPLGTCIAPVGTVRAGNVLARCTINSPSGTSEIQLMAGDMHRLPLGVGETAQIRIEPARGVDIGAGAGTEWQGDVTGGVVGLVLDGRGRPLAIATDDSQRIADLRRWYAAADLALIHDDGAAAAAER